MFLPKEMFLTSGVGSHQDKLTSFELSLRDAGIAGFNLVRVSSIFPPFCKIISKAEGISKLHTGQIVFCVMSDISTNEYNRLITSSIGVAMPNDEALHGYLSEYHSFGKDMEEAGNYAEDIAAYMLATILEGDKELIDWDSKKEIWKLDGKVVRTQNITASTHGPKNGQWTTATAAAVFII